MAHTLIRLELHTKTNTDKMSSRLASGRGDTASADAAAIKVENRVFFHTSNTRIRPAPDTTPPSLPSVAASRPITSKSQEVTHFKVNVHIATSYYQPWSFRS